MSSLLHNLLKQFQIIPKNYALYERAFIHSSYAYDKKINFDYEKLEFLGDAVIELVVTEHFYRRHINMSEGEMTKARIQIVQSKTLVRAAERLSLGKYVKVGGSIRNKPISANILEDVFEAFIGAVYLDQGLSKCYTVLKRTIIHLYETHSLNDTLDWKSKLQEFMQKFARRDICYRTINNVKNDYWVEIWINDIKQGLGHGKKIKDAQIAAAKDAYQRLTKKV